MELTSGFPQNPAMEWQRTSFGAKGGRFLRISLKRGSSNARGASASRISAAIVTMDAHGNSLHADVERPDWRSAGNMRKA